jgi:tetratricopeptide (TPR) repeat protein
VIPEQDQPASSDRVDETARPPIDDVVGQMAEGLNAEPSPPRCSGCAVPETAVYEIQAEHEDFSLAVPVRLCRRCLQKPPFAQRRDPLELIYVLSLILMVVFLLAGQLVLALICFAGGVVGGILFRPQKCRSNVDRSESLRSWLRRRACFRQLLETYPETTFFLSEDRLLASEQGASPAVRLLASVRHRRRFVCLSSRDEVARSGLPEAVGEALLELIDRTIRTFLRETHGVGGLFVQVSCAVLPQRRNAFEIQGLPVDVTRRLERRLATLPSWPVTHPVLLVVQRQLPGLSTTIQPHVESPFGVWARRLGASGELSAAEIALRLHGVQPPDGPVEIRLDDIEALRSRLPADGRLAILHAEFLQAAERYDECLEMLDALIARHPEASYFRQLRASCLDAAGRLEHAAAECQAILTRWPEDAMTLGYLAQLQLRLERPQDALATANQALDRKSHAQLYVVRAQALVTLGQFDRAMTDLNRAVAKDADTAGAYLTRARLFLRCEKYDRALADIQQYHRVAGRSLESLFLKASALRAQGKLDAAVKVFGAALKEAPDHPVLRTYRADFLAQAGKLESARADCDAVIERFPEFAPAYNTRAAVHLESGLVEAALADAERAVELGLATSQTLMIRGLAQAAAGKLDQAAADFDQAIELDAQNAFAWYHRARLHAVQDDHQAAIADCSAALELHPDWSEALVQRGFWQLAVEQIEAALTDFEAAIGISPSMAEAYRGRAYVHQQQGRAAAALADLNKAVLLDPDNVACRMARTALLLDESDADAAKDDLDAALQLAPDLIPALFQRGQLHLSLGEHEAACRDFDAILRQDPDLAFAFIGRSVAPEQAGDLEQSARDAEEAAQAAPLEADELELARLLMNAAAAHAGEQFQKAVDYATQAIELMPDRHAPYRVRAAAYWYSEHFVEALEDYQHLLSCLEEPDAGTYNGRGQVYAELGEFELALADLERAVDLARDGGAAAQLAYCLNGRGRALTGLGRYEEAERDFTESLRLRPDNAWLHYNRGLLYLSRGEPAHASACFDLALHVAKPKLTPRKLARARGFLAGKT